MRRISDVEHCNVCASACSQAFLRATGSERTLSDLASRLEKKTPAGDKIRGVEVNVIGCMAASAVTRVQIEWRRHHTQQAGARHAGRARKSGGAAQKL